MGTKSIKRITVIPLADMNQEQLKDLIQKGESEVIEFKGSLKLHNSIGEAISAFSNSKGGIILIGIEDSGKISGVDLGNNTLEKLANRIKLDTDPSIYPKISSYKLDGKDIIVIEIEECHEKPVFYKDKAYKRVGKSTHRLKASEMRKLAKNSGSKIYWDEQICERATLDDIDEDKVREFLKTAKLKRSLDIDPETPIKESLSRLDVLKEEKPTNACVLLFGKNPQRLFLQAETRCARFKGTKPITFIDMKVFDGDLIEQREDSIEFVKEHIRMEAEIKGTERIEKWEYPIEAIREAITNAICHRDYKIASNVQIRIFDDRLEIWGCGPLPEPLTVEDLKKEHRSILRNPLIGRCLFLAKFIEKWGTGTNRIIEKCLEHGLPEPLFEETSGSLVVTFRKYKVDEEILDELNHRQKKAVNYLKEHKSIKSGDLQKLFPEVSQETIRKDLKDLTNRGITKKTGSKRGTEYILA